jgi:hypothetical protein
MASDGMECKVGDDIDNNGPGLVIGFAKAVIAAVGVIIMIVILLR